MRSLAEQYEKSRAGRGAVPHRIYRLVFSHAFAEEAVLWPTIRSVLHDGDALGPTPSSRGARPETSAVPLSIVDRSRDVVDAVSRRRGRARTFS